MTMKVFAIHGNTTVAEKCINLQKLRRFANNYIDLQKNYVDLQQLHRFAKNCVDLQQLRRFAKIYVDLQTIT